MSTELCGIRSETEDLHVESIFAETSIGFGGGHTAYDCGEFPQVLVLELKFEVSAASFYCDKL